MSVAEGTKPGALRLEIFSDVICPWCFIMKRQLDRVLASLQPDAFCVRWRPYQLYPGLPAGGVERADARQTRYGDDADASHVPHGIESAATQMGIALDFQAIKRIPNTLAAHCLMERAERIGCQHALAEVLFEQHFCRGADVGDAETLEAAAIQVGMDADEARASLGCADTWLKVRAHLARARELEIVGVPCILIENRFRVPGAQGVDTLRQILARARERL